MTDVDIPTEEIETKKLRIKFLPARDPMDDDYGEKFVSIRIHIKNRNDSLDLEELSKDLADLGKWRQYKALKKELR